MSVMESTHEKKHIDSDEGLSRDSVIVLGSTCYHCVRADYGAKGNNLYYLLCENEEGRYEVYHYLFQSITLTPLLKEPRLLPCKNGLKPLRKVNPSVIFREGWIYILGGSAAHKWEITAPLWRFNVSQCYW